MPGEAGQAIYELGEIQLRRGDLSGAAASFRSAIEAGREPQPGLALLRVAEGKPGAGLAELTRTLADVVDNRVERARLLPAFVEVAVAAEQSQTARNAVEELDALATLYGSDALTATARWARGLVDLAESKPRAAVAALRDAARRWSALEAPYEAARARTLLAEAYQAIDEGESAVIELEAAHSIFERLGAVADARRAAALLRREQAAVVTETFVFSDICGSTNLVEAMGDVAWLDVLEWHDRTLRNLFREHEGEEVDHAGDGFFVAFHDPSAAFACAVAIQRTLDEHRHNYGFAPPVRIGIHTTEAIAADDGFRGKGVHTAARVGAVAEAHEILASREAAEAARVAFTDPRTVELRGISEPVELVRVDWT
jgi:class 3 adenylate cyclase